MHMGHTLGIIGGSGLYELEGLTQVEEVKVETPFGAPSDAVIRGRLGDVTLLFLPRHGRGHRLAPHRINYRANVFALKQLGAQQVLSVSAVGSLKETIHPGDFVLVDQFVDRTRARASTFFDDFAMVAHVGFGDPVDRALLDATAAAANAAGVLSNDGAPALRGGASLHIGGSYVCMEGPQFSTRAESQLYRSWGASVIGMTNLPEAKLAREAELPYATLAMVTDYDCWHESEEPVTVETVIRVLQANVRRARDVIRGLVAQLPDASASPASRALKDAIITAPELIGPETRKALAPLIGKYLS
jgi:5'-methylthioadenosine phosphorylase